MNFSAIKVKTERIDKKKANLKLVKSTRPDYQQMSDSALIIRCQNRDPEALTHLLARHQRTIYAILRRLAPDWADPSDLAQEASIRVWRSIGQLRDPQSFKTWLGQIITRLFYDELRKRPRNVQIVSIDEPLCSEKGDAVGPREIEDAAPRPEDLVLHRELSTAIDEAMSDISDQFKTAFVLRDIEGLPYEEIAQIVGCELGTVKSRISRARRKIQGRLEDYLNDCA